MAWLHFFRQDTEWSLETQSEGDSQLEWLEVKICDVTIINVYTNVSHLHHAWLEHYYLWSTTPASMLAISTATTLNGVTLECGMGICQHLTPLYNPNEPDTFHSACWNSGTNPDQAFASSTEDQPLPTCLRVLEKFPRS